MKLHEIFESDWSKTPSGNHTNNHTGRSYSKRGGGSDNGGNSSYMTPEYMAKYYREEIAKIEAGPYKRTRELEQLRKKLARVEGLQSHVA